MNDSYLYNYFTATFSISFDGIHNGIGNNNPSSKDLLKKRNYSDQWLEIKLKHLNELNFL